MPAHPVLLWSSRAVGRNGPSRFAFPPHSCWRTLNVGNPPPQRLTEYMLVVTTSVATAATDTAAAPVSSSQSHFSLSLVFSMLIQCGHGCLLELRTLVIFLLVVFLWPPSSSVICRSPQTTMKTDARSTLGEEGSTRRLTTTERRPKLHTPKVNRVSASPPICCLHRLWSYMCSLSCCLIPICYICISTDAK